MEFEESAYYAAQENHQDRILAIDGVTGIGLGLKRVNGELTDQHAVIVFVEDEATLDRFVAQSVIPDRLDGIPTDLVVAGYAKILTGPDPLQQVQRPLFGGVQISDGTGYGTLGFLALTNGGATVAVSNQHVIKGVGTVIGQPNAASRIGSTGVSVLNTRVDAAYVTLDSGVTTSGNIGKRDANGNQVLISVTGIFTPGLANLPYPAWKTGRTTFTTNGLITTINATVNHQLGPQMTNQIYIDGGNTPMAQPGDSGSALMDGQNRIVGLIWGTLTTTPNIAVASAILDVQANLGLAGPVIPVNADSQDMPINENARDIASVLHQFEASPKCAPVAAFVRAHGEEIDRLLGCNDHLAVAWHKNSGHDILMTVVHNVESGNTPLPAESINGTAVVAAIDAFGAALKARGPANIAEDAYGIRESLVRMVGKSYAEVFGDVGSGGKA